MPTLYNIPPLVPFSLEAIMFYGGVLGLIIGGMTLVNHLIRELSPKRHYRELQAKSKHGWRYIPRSADFTGHQIDTPIRKGRILQGNDPGASMEETDVEKNLSLYEIAAPSIEGRA